MGFTLNAKREHFIEWRVAFVVKTLDELREAMDAIITNPNNSYDLITKQKLITTQANSLFDELYLNLLKDIANPEHISSEEYRKKLFAIAQLYMNGYDIDWQQLHIHESHNKISLPTYPFARDRYWIPIEDKLQRK